MQRSVFSITPSITSTQITHPSATRRLAVISPESEMCPGVSRKLMRYDLSRESARTSEMGVEVMLMPRSCSAIVVSV